MNCSKCGSQNEDSAKFCPQCGCLLKDDGISSYYRDASASVPGYFPPLSSDAKEKAPKPSKPYKAEFILGLIGSVLSVVFFLIILIIGLASWMLSWLTIASSVLALASSVFGFIGASLVNCGKGKGGIFLAAGGGLGFAAVFIGSAGWLNVFCFPPLLIAGIMALAKRKRIESEVY